MAESVQDKAGLRGAERDDATRRREEIKAKHLRASGDRGSSSARGVHHVALISSDVERTVEFYQGLLEFPLTEMFENRDYGGGAHLFFFNRHRKAVGLFYLPPPRVGGYPAGVGGLPHPPPPPPPP